MPTTPAVLEVHDHFGEVGGRVELKADGSVHATRLSQQFMFNRVEDVDPKLSSGVVSICTNTRSFAALCEDGCVIHWGDGNDANDFNRVRAKLESGVRAVVGLDGSFAAIKTDDSVVTWGGNAFAQVEVAEVAFARLTEEGIMRSYFRLTGNSGIVGLKSDGSVTIMHDDNQNLETDLRFEDQLSGGVVSLHAHDYAWAVLKTDGSVLSVGSEGTGADKVQHQLQSGVKSVHATKRAFAALKEDGSVVTWGDPLLGGDLFGQELTAGATTLTSSETSFVVEMANGSQVTWGLESIQARQPQEVRRLAIKINGSRDLYNNGTRADAVHGLEPEMEPFMRIITIGKYKGPYPYEPRMINSKKSNCLVEGDSWWPPIFTDPEGEGCWCTSAMRAHQLEGALLVPCMEALTLEIDLYDHVYKVKFIDNGPESDCVDVNKLGKNDCIGKCTVEMGTVMAGGFLDGYSGELPLRRENGDDAGCIDITIEWLTPAQLEAVDAGRGRELAESWITIE